jgi:uncharacterized membrane protein YdjX (TVP38/TMEM64 family)
MTLKLSQKNGNAAFNIGLQPILIVAVVAGLLVTWQWTPLADWSRLDVLLTWLESTKESSFTPLVLIIAYMAGSLLLFPITPLIVATGMVFEPFTSIVYAELGCLLGGILTYALGSKVGRDAVHRMVGGRLNLLSRQLGKRGILAMVVIRLVPIAPFGVVNMAVGASHIRFQDFILGTSIGMLPGILMMTLFSTTLKNTLVRPSTGNYLILGATILFLFATGILLKRRINRKRDLSSSAIQ